MCSLSNPQHAQLGAAPPQPAVSQPTPGQQEAAEKDPARQEGRARRGGLTAEQGLVSRFCRTVPKTGLGEQGACMPRRPRHQPSC